MLGFGTAARKQEQSAANGLPVSSAVHLWKLLAISFYILPNVLGHVLVALDKVL